MLGLGGLLSLSGVSELVTMVSEGMPLGDVRGVLGLFFAGVVVMITGISLFRRWPRYAVRIGTASGETNVLTAKHEEYIRRIVVAMNEAIVARG